MQAHIDISMPKVLELLSIMMAKCAQRVLTVLHVSVAEGGGGGIMKRKKNCGNALLPPSPSGCFGWSCGCLLDDQNEASLMSVRQS